MKWKLKVFDKQIRCFRHFFVFFFPSFFAETIAQKISSPSKKMKTNISAWDKIRGVSNKTFLAQMLRFDCGEGCLHSALTFSTVLYACTDRNNPLNPRFIQIMLYDSTFQDKVSFRDANSTIFSYGFFFFF